MNISFVWLVKNLIFIVFVFSGELFGSPSNRDITSITLPNNECDGASEFRCLDGRCIAKENHCDGIADCHDLSDEVGCCSDNQFSCGSNHCIEQSRVCDDVNDCVDGKDESKCQCMLPNVLPTNTQVFYFNELDEIAPGTVLKLESSYVEYNCTDEHTEISESWRMNYCMIDKNGIVRWKYNTFLGCSRTCPTTIFNDDNLKFLVCRDDNKKSFNCHTEPYIFPGTTVHMLCSGNDSLTTKIVCNPNGNWTGSFPKCDIAESLILTLANNGRTTCSTESLHKPSLRLIFTGPLVSTTVYSGAKVKIVCAQEYYSYINLSTELTCNENGTWTGGEIPKCKMVCGERTGRYMIPSILNGSPTSTHIYPWVVAIYRKTSSTYSYTCGGNILSAKLVISAAHCFNRTSSYLLGVGKQFRQFIHPKDIDIQLHEISDMKYLEIYKGEETYHENDIIVLVVKQVIRFDVHIKPVCIDFEARPIEITDNLLDLDHGYIAGWEHLENHQLIDQLMFTSHPIIDDCRTYLHKNGRLNELNYLTHDKFCAGNVDYSTVCCGDSGHGLVFEKLVNNRLRFYLYGVLSLTAENCSLPSFGFYTNVQSFKEQIKNLMMDYED